MELLKKKSTFQTSNGQKVDYYQLFLVLDNLSIRIPINVKEATLKRECINVATLINE